MLFGALKNNDGIALIAVIVLMALLTIFAVTGINLTQSEVKLYANYRTAAQAFSAADRAVDFSKAYVGNGSGTVDLVTDADPVGNTYADFISDGTSGLDDEANVSRSEFLIEGPPPPGSGTDTNQFKGHYYLVEARGVAPLGGARPSRQEVEAQIARIVPK